MALRVAKKTEQIVANRIGGRREKASGAVARSNDVLTHPTQLLKGFSIEVKTTQRQSFTITETLIKTVEDKARRVGKRPLIAINLKGKLLWVVWDEDVTITEQGLVVQN